MESIIAVGIIRTMAKAIRAGEDVDTVLRKGSQGTTRNVREQIHAQIQAAMPSKREAMSEGIRDAILAAEGKLP